MNQLVKLFRSVHSCGTTATRNCFFKHVYKYEINHQRNIWMCRNTNNLNNNVCQRIFFSSIQVNQNFKPIEVENVRDATEVLSNLSKEDQKKLLTIQLEYEAWQALGVRVPDHITDTDWLDIFQNHHTSSSRKRYYNYLFKREKAIENKRIKKAKRHEQHLIRQAEQKRLIVEGELPPVKNTYNLRIQEKTMNHWYYNNFAFAAQHGPHMVIDCGFEKEMSKKELDNLYKQIALMNHVNKVHKSPIHLHFCNVDAESKSAALLKKYVPNIDNIPYTISENGYLDHYPKERLLYLSPDARNVLRNFDEDDVYIIGGLVDKGPNKPYTYAKAKREGIRMAKLPLDNYVRWVQGSKYLTLNQVLKIMLDLRRTNDWHQALSNLPKRKVAFYEDD